MESVYRQSAEARIDEETRKELIRFFKTGKPYDCPCAKIRQRWVSWLEKQGKQETDEWREGNIIRHGGILALVIKGRRAMKSNGELFTVQYPDEWVKAAPNEIERFLNELGKKGEQKPVIDIDIPFGAKDSELQEVTYYIPEGFHAEIEGNNVVIKKGEQKSTEWHREDEQNLNACLGYITDEFLCMWLKDAVHAKYDKPADKVEPKFNVGVWVVNKLGDSWHIDSLDKKNYQVSDGKGNYNYFPISKQDEMHLWTIQDAKEGDVLAAHECLVLFKKLDGLNIRCYCTYNFMNLESFFVDTLQNKTAFLPSTELQRTLLFKRIIEAGYEWDAEHKEFKKIEQRSADKVEPKFKVGDWIISDEAHEDYRICKITNVENGNYTIESIYGYKGYNTFETFDECYHLWTIEDAKDGDVLTTDLAHFILKSKDNMSCYMYCNYSVVSNNFGTSDTAIVDSNYVHPTTKEQCDLLFQKITEAGYEWDAEKKKLKKIKQKPVDKVEPKFKVGDWVVTSYGKVNQVVSVDKDGDGYTLDDGVYFSGHWCDMYHLWTIKDAKDGDVLYENDTKTILIFKSQTCGWIKVYCDFWINKNKFTGTDRADYGRVSEMDLKPATKEQCNLLFQKMKEAGYEWDVEKKELRKIEQKPVNGEDYGIDGLWHAQNILEKTLGKVVGYQSDDGILEHECAISAVKRLYEQKSEQKSLWSEEDVELYQGVIETELYMLDVANGVKVFDVGNESIKVECQRELDWLKSLKERVQPRSKQEWKPSDEQIQALDEVYKTHGANNVCRRVLFNLMNDLKKLKEE